MTITLELLFPHLDDLIQTPTDVQRLNEAILQLAVQGKLVPQDPHDEPAGELLRRVSAEKRISFRAEIIEQSKTLSSVDADKRPFTLPLGWQWVKTQTVCQSINDGDHQPPPKSESGIPFLVISNIRSGRLDFSNTRFVSEEYYDTIQDVRKPRKGDILYSIVGSLGTAVLIESNIKFCFQRHMALFRSNEAMNPEFLYYLLKSPLVLNQARECATGIAQLTIPMAGLRKILIPLPPLAEQKRIVAKVDELFAQTRALEAKLRRAQEAIVVVNRAVLHQLHHAADNATFQHAAQILGDHFDLLYTDPRPVTDLRQTILQLAVQGKLVPQDPHDEPAGELLKRIDAEKERLVAEGKIKKEKLFPSINEDKVSFGVPVNWQWIRFGVLAQIQSGYAFKSEWYSSTGIRLVRNVNIGHGSIDWSDTANLPVDKREEFANFELKENDLLISLDRPIISTGLKLVQVTHNDLPSLLVQRVGRMLFFCDDWIDLDYVKIWLKSSVFLDSIDPGRSNGVPHISQKDVANAPFPLPPLAEQKRIVAKVDELLARCAALESKLGQAQVAGRQLTAAVLHGAVG